MKMLRPLALTGGMLLSLMTQAQTPYTNDFSDNSLPLKAVGRGDCRIADGVLRTCDNRYAVFGDSLLTDYAVTFRARNPKDAEQVQLWAGFRAASRFDRYVVGVKGGLLDQVYLMRLGYMGTDEFLGVRPLRFHPEPGQWYTVKVEVVGRRIRVFIGDEPLPYIDVTDTNGLATARGPVTLGSGWIPTEYDDLTITPLTADALDGVPTTEFAQRLTPQQKEQKRQQERSAYQPVRVAALGDAARTDVSLDGQWLFMPHYQMSDRQRAVSPDAGDSDWHVMEVPRFWNPTRIWLHGETMGTPRGQQSKGVSDRYYQDETDRCENYTFDYQRTNGAWYRQWVELPQDVEGRVLTLSLDAVSKTADIYINGQLAHSHVGMFGPISFDATPYLHPGRNLIAVSVMRNKDNNAEADNDALDAFYARAQGNAVRQSTADDTQQRPTDLLRDMPHGFYGGDPAGIWQPVRLSISGQARVEDVFIQPELDGAAFDITLRNYAHRKGTYRVQTEIADHLTGELLYSGTSLRRVTLAGGGELTEQFAISGLQPKLWSPEHPNLYDFKFSIVPIDTIGTIATIATDELTVTSGFRTFRVRDGQFELNGVKYWLRGGNHVPSAICPHDSALARRFFRLMHDAGIMTTRTHTAPFNELWMQAADEEGIGVSYEGTWSWLMLEDRPIPNDDLLEMYEQEWCDLLRKYRNHPSLLLWTVNNEMKFYDLDPDPDRARRKITVISDLVQRMRGVDPTRPMVYDSNYFRKGKPENYGADFYATIDDGDADDVHAYYNWYDYSFFRFFKGEFQEWFKTPGRPLISQEMSSGYSNNETGHPVRSYQLIHQNPLSLCGYNAYDWSNPQYFLQTLAFNTKELGEALRRTCPEASGVMHFSLLTWFRQAYDAEHITPWPAYYGLQKALQPVLVSAELWGRNVYGGTPLTTRFYVVNDREDGTTIQPSVIHWQFVGEDGQVLSEGQEPVKAIEGYEHYFIEPRITVPEVDRKQTVSFQLSLCEDGREISANDYDLTVAPRAPQALGGFDGAYRQRIICGPDTLTPQQADELRRFIEQGGHVVFLDAKEAARQVFPEYITGWIEPTEGDVCFMEREDDPVFDGIGRMELRFWNDGRREMPRVCSAVLKTVRSPQVIELAGQMKIHAYIDGGSPEDRIRRIEQMRGFTLIRIHHGSGTALVSTMRTDKAPTDPIAAQLLSNMILTTAK